jgi:hypothetical protein
MALVVEDGTGLSTAEAYISVEDATTYFAARGNATWSGLASDTVREQLLRKAADYMEGAYRLRWKGVRNTETQALSWPRTDVVVDDFDLATDEVPTLVARANAELAVRAAAGDLLGDASAQVVQETVGPISVTYAPGARQGTAYKAVDAMLQPLLARGANTASVVRA